MTAARRLAVIIGVAAAVGGLTLPPRAADALIPTHARSMPGVRRANSRPGCPRTFTVPMTRRAIDVVYGGTRNVSSTQVQMVHRMIHCQRNVGARGYVRGYWQREVAEWKAARSPPLATAVASVFDAAGGPIACSGMDSYGMGVANKSLPCGTHVRICYSGCVDAQVFDRGPYIAGRSFDLSRAVQHAVGFPDGVATIHYAIKR